jgi:prevent-host-death family protein
MNWSVAEAKQQLSEVLRRAASRPQTITKHARDIAVVVDVEAFREFQQWKAAGRRKTVAQAFEDLRTLPGKRGAALPAPARRNRRAPFLPPAE